jgi:hypothetical protein
VPRRLRRIRARGRRLLLPALRATRLPTHPKRAPRTAILRTTLALRSIEA